MPGRAVTLDYMAQGIRRSTVFEPCARLDLSTGRHLECRRTSEAFRIEAPAWTSGASIQRHGVPRSVNRLTRAKSSVGKYSFFGFRKSDHLNVQRVRLVPVS
jgi:hypothetical protein